MAATRDAFGHALMKLAEDDPRYYIVDCDISKSMKTVEFARAFKEQHVNVGIAEQNAASLCAGLAVMGKIPFLSTYAVFASMRALEQLRTSVCYPNLNVKIAASHGGLTPSNDGATHQAIEDVAIMRALPNMSVVMGADYNSAKALTLCAARHMGPVYLRYTRDDFPDFYDEREVFELGKGKLLRKGGAVTLVSFGEMLHEALFACELLRQEGIEVDLIDMHTVKPLDEGLLKDSLSRTHACVTVEDHSVIGGLGGAVAEFMAGLGLGRLRRIGLPDCFGQSGKYRELLEHYGMDRGAIAETVRALLKEKE
jgi:transketolase